MVCNTKMRGSIFFLIFVVILANTRGHTQLAWMFDSAQLGVID